MIVPNGPWAGQRWPDGMLDWPAGRIGDLRCPIISPSAQIEIKKWCCYGFPACREGQKTPRTSRSFRRPSPLGKRVEPASASQRHHSSTTAANPGRSQRVTQRHSNVISEVNTDYSISGACQSQPRD